jgi:hypothetical protein
LAGRIRGIPGLRADGTGKPRLRRAACNEAWIITRARETTLALKVVTEEARRATPCRLIAGKPTAWTAQAVPTWVHERRLSREAPGK